MADKLVPQDVHAAAKRGFIRTTAQAYGTALAGGITLVFLTDAFAQASSGDWVPLLLGAIVTILSPLIAGASSYFSILGQGIPADYAPVTSPPSNPVVATDGPTNPDVNYPTQ